MMSVRPTWSVPDSKSTVSIELLGHASVLMRFGAINILTDPHFRENFGSGHFGYFPARRVHVEELPELDAVFISHSHRDHFDVASLAQIDRNVPVFCPVDARIHLVLHELGFAQVISVQDWSSIQPLPSLRVIWTPSSYRVPEHGFAIQYKGFYLWDMVDTVVEIPGTCEKVLSILGTDQLDLLMLPCFPLLETAVTDGLDPALEADEFDDTQKLLKSTSPRHILPFADGHFCTGRAEWLNHFKFPVSGTRVERVLRASAPNSTLLRWTPGRTFTIDVSSSKPPVRSTEQASRIVRPLDKIQDRSFLPAGRIDPLFSTSVASKYGGFDFVEKAIDISSRLDPRVHGEYSFSPCLYRFLALDENGAVAEDRHILVDESGCMSVKTGQGSADIEVAITYEDLHAIRSGMLGYSSAFLGGRLREWRPGGINLHPAKMLIRPGSTVPENQKVAYSGIFLLNTLLRKEDDSVFRGLRAEVRSAKEGNSLQAYTGNPPPSRTQRLVQLPATSPHPAVRQVGLPEPDTEGTFIGTLGPEAGPPSPPDVSSHGVLVLASVVEAQPHMGSGVRFPYDAYQTLLHYILSSRIWKWHLRWGFSEEYAVPFWRLASLFPVTRERLQADLAKRGWDGELHGDERPGGRTVEWWHGMPDIGGDCLTARFIDGHPLAGERVCVLQYEGDLPRTATQREKWLVSGSFRFSWILPLRDTRNYMPSSRNMPFNRWTESRAMLALQGRMTDGLADVHTSWERMPR
ncbi:MBL fold metallo-hydrolase [Streptomyces iakyrus]|uniref:MBL fold metallo-hydrolase n=1 Tax=Streptomyces iakyrus TaxID=68219 RepID=UPI0036E1A9CD